LSEKESRATRVATAFGETSFPLWIRHRRNLAGPGMIAWMLPQILIHFVTGNTNLMKIVFVVTDDALVLASAFGFTFTLFLALSTAGRRPKSEPEAESDDEKTFSFAHLRRPQI
jgi:hypothetical protein